MKKGLKMIFSKKCKLLVVNPMSVCSNLLSSFVNTTAGFSY
jgi:hypothetical protein